MESLIVTPGAVSTKENSTESLTITPGAASTSLQAPVPSISAISPPAREDWPSILGDWNHLRDEVVLRLAAFHRSFAEPIKVVDDQIEINEYAMVPEKPYLVEYKDGLREFIRKMDGSIVISEVVIAK